MLKLVVDNGRSEALKLWDQGRYYNEWSQQAVEKARKEGAPGKL